MKIRYKKTRTEVSSNSFNTHSLNEVLTGDDSVFISELDVWINGVWKDMGQAFKDRDIIPDNYNRIFGEPRNATDKDRGYFA